MIASFVGRLAELVGAIGLDALRSAGITAHYLGELAVWPRALAALWLCLCTSVVSLYLTRRWLPSLTLPLRWSSCFCIGMWLSTLGFHALRSLGLFELPYALIACSALSAAVLYPRQGYTSLPRILRSEGRALRRVFVLFRRSPHNLWTGFLVGAAALLGARALVVPPLGWDTLVYHGPRAALWVHSGQLTFDPSPGPFALYRYFFAGGEVFAAWAMLPFHSDLFANLASVVQWIGVGLTCWALARVLGVREPFAATSGAVVMFAPALQFEVNSGYIELVLNLALLHALTLAVYAMRRCSVPVCIAAAMSAGLAAGIKLTGVAPALVACCALALRVLSMNSWTWKRRLGCLVASGACVLIPAAPWALLAWLDTGNPIFPFNLPSWLPFVHPGPVVQGLPSNTGVFDWAGETKAVLLMFGPVERSSEGLGSLAVIPILAFPLGWTVLCRRRPVAALMLGAAAAGPIFAYFLIISKEARLENPIGNARYLVSSLALIVPISFALCERSNLLGRSYRLLAIMYPVTYAVEGVRRGWASWETRDVIIVGAGILLAVVCVRSCRDTRWRVALVLGLWMLGCSALQVRRDETRPHALADSTALHWSPRYWAAAAGFIDRPDEMHRIALTGGNPRYGDAWFPYFLFGPRFRNSVHYVPPTQDGAILHFTAQGVLAGPVDAPAWLARLTALQATEVMTFPPRSVEQSWMDGKPDRFQRLFGSDEWGLYRFKR